MLCSYKRMRVLWLVLVSVLLCSIENEASSLTTEERYENSLEAVKLEKQRSRSRWRLRRLTKSQRKLRERRSDDEKAKSLERGKQINAKHEGKNKRFASFRRNGNRTHFSDLEGPGSETRTKRTSIIARRKQGRRKKLEERQAIALRKLQQCKDTMAASSLRRWQRLLRRGHVIEADVKSAYQMAVLASLAYWDFHKRRMPENASGFRLISGSTTSFQRVSLLAKSFRKSTRTMRVKLCHFKRRMFPVRKLRRILRAVGRFGKPARQDATILAPPSCEVLLRSKKSHRRRYTFNYWLYDWAEPTAVPGVKYHDTDLLVSTSGNDVLALSFAGTASVADHFTNAQTFESASHSGLFNGGGYAKNATIQGSLHRGFLNAYSRVERGSVLRLCQDCTSENKKLTRSLFRRYENCTGEAKDFEQKQKKRNNRVAENATSAITSSSKSTETTRDGRKTVGCRVRDEKLKTVLREVVTDALSSGRTVHLTGHSLGGGIASLLALDVIINFPEVPVSKLHIWTFGAPQVVDDVFLRSAIEIAPRLRRFVEKGRKKRFRRFVTLSDDCKVDLVTTVAEKALPSHKRNLRGHAARSLGGVRGSIIHFAEPHYLFTPDQHDANATFAEAGGAIPKTTTRSTLSAHFVRNYVQGISRESKDHPLSTDLPGDVREWIGEVPMLKSTNKKGRKDRNKTE